MHTGSNVHEPLSAGTHPARPRRHRLRTLRRWLTGLILVAGLATFPAGWGPRLATVILCRSPLRRAFPELAFQMRYLSPARAVVDDIRLGTDAEAPAIRRMEAEYSLRGLCDRTLDAVRITGPSATIWVTSNQLAVHGLDMWPQATATDAQPSAPSRMWRVGSAEVNDIRMKMRQAEQTAPDVDMLTGTLLVAGVRDGGYRLAWTGNLAGVPAWLNGDLRLPATEGTLSIAAPWVTSHSLQSLAGQWLPDLAWPAVDGAVSVSAKVELAEGGVSNATLRVLSREALSWGTGSWTVRLHPVMADGQWIAATGGRKGLLRDVAVEAVVDGIDGLPATVAHAIRQSVLSLQLDDTALPADLAQPWSLNGRFSLPLLPSATNGTPSEVVFGGSVTTNHVHVQFHAPSVARTVAVGTVPVAWRSGELALNLDASRQMQAGTPGWRVEAEAACRGAELNHPEVGIVNASARVPLSGWLVPGSTQVFHLATIRPRIDWTSAHVRHQSLTVTNASTESVPDVPTAGIVRLLSSLQLDAPGLFSGVVGVDLQADVQSGKAASGRFRATLDQGTLSLTNPIAIDLQGLHTTLTLAADGHGGSRLLPIESTFTRAVVAGIVIDGGRVRWRLDPDELLIERADLGWCGGTLRLYAVRVDLRQPDIDLVLYAEQIEAGALLALIKPLHGTATGHLYGRIPLRVDGGRIRLSEGFLYALPGEAGHLQLASTPFMRDYLARTSLPDAMQKNIMATLADLTYHVLRFDLDAASVREARLVMKLAGKASKDGSLPPVDLDVRVNGPLESLLNFGLQMNSGSP